MDRRSLPLLLRIACALCLSASAVVDAQAPSARADTLPADLLAPERVTAARASRDEETRNALQALFDRIPGFDRVDVTVDAGVVRLEGTVVDAGTRTRAIRLAEQMEGVLFVVDLTRESTSLEEQLQPTWARLRALGYSAVAKIPLALVALIIVALSAWVGRLLAHWSGPAFLDTRNPFLQVLIRRAFQVIVVILGLILALDLLEATALVGAVAGTAGLAGLVIGFAFKDIVENYLAGTLLAVRQPFAKNDQILVGEFEGKVVRLTPRETILMSLQGNHIRMPNALILRSPLTNFTRNPLRRLEFEYGIGPADDLVLARTVSVATLAAMEGVMADPRPETHVVTIGDSSVTMRSMAWVDQREAEFLRVRSEAIRLVKAALEDAGITIPSPEFHIRMRSDAVVPPPIPQPSRPRAGAGQADVSVDRTVDRQIEVERQESGEADLLDDGKRGSS